MIVIALIRRNPIRSAVLFALGFQIVAFLVARWQPMSTDEADFFMAAAFWSQANSKVPHPQLVVHTIQLFLLLFGVSVDSARLSILLPNMLTVLMIPWLSRLTFRDTLGAKAADTVAVIATLLYISVPLVIQSELLVDIDNGLLSTVLLLYLCLWLQSGTWPTGKRVAVLSAALVLCLWTKLPTPPLLIAAIATYCVLRRDWKGLGTLTAATVAGTLVFAASQWVYGALTAFDFTGELSAFAKIGGTISGNSASSASRAFQTFGVFAFWIGFPLCILFGAAIGSAVNRLVRGRLEPRDLVLGYALLVVLVYGMLFFPAWGWPRYQVPALPALSVVVAGMLAPLLMRREKILLLWLVVAGALTFAYVFVVVGDPLYDLYRSTFETVSLAERVSVSLRGIAKLLPPLVVFLGGGLWLARRYQLGTTRVFLLTGAALSIGLALETNLVQLTANYSTRYRYTYVYADRLETMRRVDEVVPVNGTLLADREIFDYARRRGQYVHPFLCADCTADGLERFLAANRQDAIVWAEKEWLKAPIVAADAGLQALFDRCYDRETHGIFTVLVRTSRTGCELP